MISNKKMITPTLLALLATVVGAFAAWWAAKQQDEYNNELITAQKEIARLNNEIAQSVTGGDGHCFVNFFYKEPGIAEVDVISDSRYPLYDIEIRIRPFFPPDDFDVNRDTTKIDRDVYQFMVGTLPPMKSQIVTSRKLGVVNYGHKKRWFYTVDFTARNGQWRQVWDFSLDNSGEPVGSHVIYKVVVENGTKKNIIINRSHNPKSSASIVNSLITEYAPYDSSSRVLMREE